MADQTFAVSSGFYDAVNSDRTYSADDMNRPYKRLVSNGVFATPQGTKSTDLQVVAAGGMQIIVKPGEGIFADKWFENPAAINITVPSNTSTSPRIDSVIVQVDKRTSGRVGNIVYRTGTPSSNPSAPAINTTTNVIEYRLANIRVAASAASITGGVITDRRGSSDCPWITSLIYQVDTSTLYDQWAAAYEEYFETEKAMWDDWYSHLTEELDVSMTLAKFTNTVVTTSDTSEIEIGISNFNFNTDILEVYINGLKAIEGVQYTVNDNTSISLTAPLNAGQVVSFVVLKSVIMGNATDIMSIITALEERISSIQGGTPTVVDTTSDMTDTDKIYILSTDSKWYYYNLSSSEWVIGGTYGGVPTDTTLTQSGMAADAKTVGDAINPMRTATSSDVGKALKAKTVTNGKVTEWEFGETDIDPEVIDQSVSDWMDDHPEATTTVQDGSITEQKLNSNLKNVLLKYEEQTKSIDISMEYIEDSLVYITSFTPSGISFQNTNGDNTSDATAVMNLLDFARSANYPIMTNSIWHNGYHINNGIVEYSRKTHPSEWSSFCYYSGFNGNNIVFFDAMANPNYSSSDLIANGDTWGLTYPPIIVNGEAFNISSWISTYCTTEPLATNIRALVSNKGARQVIAKKNDEKIYIFTFTGKSNGFLRGVNYTEMQNYLLEKGVINAINLDGGGSTQTVVNRFPLTRTQDRSTVNGRLIPIALCFEL